MRLIDYQLIKQIYVIEFLIFKNFQTKSKSKSYLFVKYLDINLRVELSWLTFKL